MLMDIMQKRERKDPLTTLYSEPLFSLSELYHEASKLTKVNGRDYRRNIQKVTGSPFFLRRLMQPYKTYPTLPFIALPNSDEMTEPQPALALKQMIAERRSAREFAEPGIGLEEASILLRNAYGITGDLKLPFDIDHKVRGVPSGGALYPLELYLVSFRVNGLERGVYHYNVLEHGLEFVQAGDFAEKLGAAYFLQDTFKTAAALVLIAGVLQRSAIKYGERAYRFMLIEAGHVGQNLCLSAAALSLGCVPLGGFMDDEINEVLGLDGVNEMALYGAAFGQKAATSEAAVGHD
jgi:SagB-type dehydrogenase family enzyme